MILKVHPLLNMVIYVLHFNICFVQLQTTISINIAMLFYDFVLATLL